MVSIKTRQEIVLNQIYGAPLTKAILWDATCKILNKYSFANSESGLGKPATGTLRGKENFE